MKTRVKRIALILLLGAATNVVVAWACAFWSEAGGRIAELRFDGARRVEESVFAPAWTVPSNPDTLAAGRHIRIYFGFGLRVCDATLSANQSNVLIVQCGWPWISFTCDRKIGTSMDGWTGQRRIPPPLRIEWRNGLVVPSWARTAPMVNDIGARSRSDFSVNIDVLLPDIDGPSRPLPFHPVMRGLALGAMLYASVLWLTTLLVRQVRAVVRRREGHCLKCNYDRTGLAGASPCPECGAVHAPSAQTLT
jgi:hypothetical protein